MFSEKKETKIVLNKFVSWKSWSLILAGLIFILGIMMYGNAIYHLTDQYMVPSSLRGLIPLKLYIDWENRFYFQYPSSWRWVPTPPETKNIFGTLLLDNKPIYIPSKAYPDEGYVFYYDGSAVSIRTVNRKTSNGELNIPELKVKNPHGVKYFFQKKGQGMGSTLPYLAMHTEAQFFSPDFSKSVIIHFSNQITDGDINKIIESFNFY